MTVATAAIDAEAIDQTIGFNVHALLYRRKSNQKQLALVLGVTPSVLSKKLRGESSWSARQVALTAVFLDVEPGRLFIATTPAKMRAKLAAITGQGLSHQPSLPLLHTVQNAHNMQSGVS